MKMSADNSKRLKNELNMKESFLHIGTSVYFLFTYHIMSGTGLPSVCTVKTASPPMAPLALCSFLIKSGA